MEQLETRDALRGTGRTTRALDKAIEHAKAHATSKPGRTPCAILVVHNKEQWDYIKTLRKDMTAKSSVRRTLYFGDVAIYVMTPEDAAQRMRGYDCPIIVDHSVWERVYDSLTSERHVAEMTFLYQHRIVP